MNVLWTKDHLEEDYSTCTGVDEYGNIFHMSANGEVVIVNMTNGYVGIGWTAEEAVRSAEKKRIAAPGTPS